jgi:putative cell wall-binding protein
LRNLARLLALTLLTGLLSAAPAAAMPAPAGATTGAAVASAAIGLDGLSTAKVVIIVGATHSATQNYRDIADEAYAVAIQYSSNVVKVYSPNATWDAVKTALQGANVVIYLGHGNGWPSPYGNDPAFTTKDGFGLNATAGNGDYNVKYYGEPSLAEVSLAPNAIVFLNHLCYSAGNSEPGLPDPTRDVAMQRVDNYGQGFFKAGAGAVIAEAHGSIDGMIRDLFTTQESILDLWRTQPDFHGNEFSFASFRSPENTAFMDPETPDGGYFRSLVGNPSLLTTDITGGIATTPAPGADPSRLWGADRYATAAAVSAATFAPGPPVVYVATGADFADALVGGPVAGSRQVPILLVTRTSVPPATATELARLRPGSIVVLGIQTSVSDGVLEALAPFTTGTVTRIGGVGHYASAAAISSANFSPGVPVVYIATGENFPDALAGAAVGALRGGPILFTDPSGTSIPAVTSAELTRLAPRSIVILGGDGVVSPEIEAALTRYTTGSVVRLSGMDRYATAAAISAANYAPGVGVVYIATGLNFPDALAGAPAAGLNGAPVLLVKYDSIPAATAAELARLRPARIVILGGAGVVSAAVARALLP